MHAEGQNPKEEQCLQRHETLSLKQEPCQHQDESGSTRGNKVNSEDERENFQGCEHCLHEGKSQSRQETGDGWSSTRQCSGTTNSVPNPAAEEAAEHQLIRYAASNGFKLVYMRHIYHLNQVILDIYVILPACWVGKLPNAIVASLKKTLCRPFSKQ